MKRVIADKIASVTRSIPLRRDLRVTDEIACKEGAVVAVRILNEKTHYNTLELTTGRFAAIKPGDIIVGALGFRNALLGYSGVLPEKLKPGDKINVLNLGGVLGHCTSYSPSVGEPFQAEVLGQVLTFGELGSRKGTAANIASHCPALVDELPTVRTPIVAVVGTCMNSGKTEACLALIQQFVRKGLRVVAAKTTGVSLRRDVLAMEDAGAERALIFTDFGVVTTSAKTSAQLTCTMLAELDQLNADVIVVELGDGLMGDYGVDAILEHPDLQRHLTHIVLAANDPVGAWGGVRMMAERYNLRPAVVTGPATDHEAGSRLIEAQLDVPAINARSKPEPFAKLLISTLGLTHGK